MTITPQMFDRQRIAKAARNPGLAAREMERVLKKPLRVPRRLLFSLQYDTVDVMERDWDTLAILDACRYDKFKEANPFERDAEPVVVDASQSAEFCETYFAGRIYHDTVYVTANPYGARVDRDVFHDVCVTFDDENTGEVKARVENVEESWSPEQVYRRALAAHEEHPDKRLVVHFMQPHAPYYGSKAATVRDDLRDQGLRFWAWNDEIDREERNRDENVVSHLLSAAQRGEISTTTLEEVYRENLAVVLEYVQRLFESVDGKAAITSDHGEMIGERKLSLPKRRGHLINYIGHERDVYARELREVPWLTIESGQRRAVTEESPLEDDAPTESDVESQLRALGYKG